MTTNEMSRAREPAEKAQSFANHRVIAVPFLVAGAVLAADLVVRAVAACRDPQVSTLWPVVPGLAILVVWHMSRAKAMRVQDRVIRLEMQLRLERVLPPDARHDIEQLTLRQLIALRFAGDAELPALVRAVRDGDVSGEREIKRRVNAWRADWLRV